MSPPNNSLSAHLESTRIFAQHHPGLNRPATTRLDGPTTTGAIVRVGKEVCDQDHAIMTRISARAKPVCSHTGALTKLFLYSFAMSGFFAAGAVLTNHQGWTHISLEELYESLKIPVGAFFAPQYLLYVYDCWAEPRFTPEGAAIWSAIKLATAMAVLDLVAGISCGQHWAMPWRCVSGWTYFFTVLVVTVVVSSVRAYMRRDK